MVNIKRYYSNYKVVLQYLEGAITAIRKWCYSIYKEVLQ